MEILVKFYQASPIHWHPALVHFPIALLVMALVFDLCYLLFRRASFESAGSWSLLAGAFFGILAVLSGLLAEESLLQHTDRGHELMETHQIIGYVLLGLFGLLTLWRLAARWTLPQKGRPLFVLLMLGGVGLLGYQGYLGGEMVFQEAMGVNFKTMQELVAKPKRGSGHVHLGSEVPSPVPEAASGPADSPTSAPQASETTPTAKAEGTP